MSASNADAGALHNAEGERLENLGFTWCKIGSIALIAMFPRVALVLASALAIYYYARAMMLGVNRSACILRHPLIIIGFWSLALVATLASVVWPEVAGHLHTLPRP